jgi:hypothetical protein
MLTVVTNMTAAIMEHIISTCSLPNASITLKIVKAESLRNQEK